MGYYRGFSCPLGHQIRDKKEHWCYQCVRRIQGNICGLDINYLHNIYQQDAREVLSLVEIKKPTECWPIHLEDDLYREYKTPKRINFPSYRTGQMDRRTDRVSIHKAIYTSARFQLEHICNGLPHHLLRQRRLTRMLPTSPQVNV